MSAVLADTQQPTRFVPLGNAVVFNPKPPRNSLAQDLEVSFVPMAAVGAATGQIDVADVRTYASVKKGFTSFCDGDVLFAKITPCMENGKMVVARGLRNGIGFGSTEFHVLRPREGVDPHYVYHFISSAVFRRDAAHHMTGAVGQKRVPLAYLQQCEIPLPPFHEQRSIVVEIEKQFSRLDEGVANLKRVKGNLKRYTATVLHAAAAGHLQRGTVSQAVSASVEVSGLPPGWQLVRVDQAGDVLLGRQRAPQYLTGAHSKKYLRVANIKDDAINFDDVESMDFDEKHFEKYRLAAGDILVSEGQSPELLGQSAIFRGYGLSLCFQKTLHRFRARPGITTPEFAQIVFRAHVKSGVFRRIGSITTNIGHLTLEKFRAAPFPLPPLIDQLRIVAEVERRLSVVREADAAVDANLKRVQVLRQAALCKVFGSQRLPG